MKRIIAKLIKDKTKNLIICTIFDNYIHEYIKNVENLFNICWDSEFKLEYELETITFKPNPVSEYSITVNYNNGYVIYFIVKFTGTGNNNYKVNVISKISIKRRKIWKI